MLTEQPGRDLELVEHQHWCCWKEQHPQLTPDIVSPGDTVGAATPLTMALTATVAQAQSILPTLDRR